MRAAVYVLCSTAGKKKVGDVSVFLQNPDTQVKPSAPARAHTGNVLLLASCSQEPAALEGTRSFHGPMSRRPIAPFAGES
jgi:hypothetical protein